MKPAGLAALAAVLLCVLAPHPGVAQADETPRAGEPVHVTLFGRDIDIAARDRRRVTSVTAEVLWAPAGAQDHRVGPGGALFLWRNREETGELLRAEIALIANDVRYSRPLTSGGLQAVATFESVTLPWSNSETLEGMRDASGQLKPRSLRGGLGLGYRRALSPGYQDNFFETSLSYEPGYLFFARGPDTAASFVLPRDAYEGRIHLRVRADAFERNLLELPHNGWAAGLDARRGSRAGWKDWGGGAFGIQTSENSARWSSVNGYCVFASHLPFLPLERHRLLLSAYGGTGRDLDRFSAFRLDGFSNEGDWESLSRPVLEGAAADEFFSSRYGIGTLEYRYQALVFLFLQAKGTLAWIDRARQTPQGEVQRRTEPANAVTAAVTSGFLWNLSVEISWSHNFGVLRRHGDKVEKGGQTLFLSLTKILAPGR